MKQLSFLANMELIMTTKVFFAVTPEERAKVVAFAKATNKSATTIKKYASGEADNENLLQMLAQYRTELTPTETSPTVDWEATAETRAYAISRLHAEITELKATHDNIIFYSNEQIAQFKHSITTMDNALMTIRRIAAGMWFSSAKQIVSICNKALKDAFSVS